MESYKQLITKAATCIVFPTSTNIIKYIFTACKRSLRRLCLHRCLSVHRGHVCSIACWDTHTPQADTHLPQSRHPLGRPPGRHPPAQCMLGYTRPLHSACWDTPPVQCMLGYGQQVGGTHPTGMHSCHTCTFITTTDRLKFYIIFSFLYSYLNQKATKLTAESILFC